MADKRIIELTAADSIIDSDFAAIDNNENSGNEQGSRKIRMTKVKEYVNEDMVPLEMIADEWQAYEDYYPGDYVTHNGDLYRQKEDGIIIQISWVPTMWEKVSVGDEFKDAFKIATNFYSDSSTYNTDDLVVYQNKLYRCKEDNVTGTWTSSKWQQTTLAAELKNSGKVQDVKVNGTSVVTDTIANITSYKEVTQAQYDALPSSKTSDDVLYCIKDAEVNILDMPEIQAALAVGTITNQPIATFTDGSTLPMPKLEIAIEPIQEGSGVPSPTNIRPISGWDECNVTRCGKNLFDESILLECSGWTVSNGVYSGDSASVNAKYGTGVPNLAFKPNTQYTFSFTYGQDGSAGIGLAFIIRYTDNTVSQKYCTLDSIGFVSVTSTAGKSIKRIELSYGSNRTIHLSNMQLEESTTATTYETYNGHTYTIDLDGTRYGGTLDVVSGVLTVTLENVDLGSLDWNYADNRFQTLGLVNLIKKPSSGRSAEGLICSNYIASTSGSDKTYFKYVTGDIYIYDSTYTDATDFKTAMNGVQLVYELATPLTIQLTPTQVNSLLNCNVWGDTGDVIEVKYYRNATTTINDLISRIEALES